MYTYTWKKYLPVIRLLLKRAAAAEQSITLNRIDFEKNNRIRKPVCSFAIEVLNGRFSAMTQSVPAKDLMEILMLDDAARTLLRGNHFLISLDSSFQLRIKNIAPASDNIIEDTTTPQSETTTIDEGKDGNMTSAESKKGKQS